MIYKGAGKLLWQIDERTDERPIGKTQAELYNNGPRTFSYNQNRIILKIIMF